MEIYSRLLSLLFRSQEAVFTNCPLTAEHSVAPLCSQIYLKLFALVHQCKCELWRRCQSEERTLNIFPVKSYRIQVKEMSAEWVNLLGCITVKILKFVFGQIKVSLKLIAKVFIHSEIFPLLVRLQPQECILCNKFTPDNAKLWNWNKIVPAYFNK